MLHVRVRLRVSWGKKTEDWEGRAEFYLRRKGRGYRIVYWDCPWEEIKAFRASRRKQKAASHPRE